MKKKIPTCKCGEGMALIARLLVISLTIYIPIAVCSVYPNTGMIIILVLTYFLLLVVGKWVYSCWIRAKERRCAADGCRCPCHQTKKCKCKCHYWCNRDLENSYWDQLYGGHESAFEPTEDYCSECSWHKYVDLEDLNCLCECHKRAMAQKKIREATIKLKASCSCGCHNWCIPKKS